MPVMQPSLRRIGALLAVMLAGLPIATRAQEQPSRLRYTAPPGWQQQRDPDTQLVSLIAPGGGASITFASSSEYPGTTEQFHAAFLMNLMEDMPLASPQVVPGEQGAFKTSMGVFTTPDGQHPWVCVYTLVNQGRGEAVLFMAAGEQQFLAQLRTVNEMIYRVTVGGAPGPATTRAAPPPVAPPVAQANLPTVQPQPPAAVPGLSVRVGDPLPTFEFTMAQDFFGGTGPGFYSSLNGDATIGVYAFRQFSGDMGQTFNTTLFRDWINGRQQERQVLKRTALQPFAVAGATQALLVQFTEEYFGGTPREHIRAAILASQAVAIIDISVQDASSLQRYSDQFGRFLGSIRIVGAAPSPAPAPAQALTQAPPPAQSRPAFGVPAQGSVAGLYIAAKQQFQPNPFGAVGSGTWVVGTESYLLSADGRVYRARGLPQAPGGDISRFDFGAAQRSDPANTGTYSVNGNQVIIQFPGETTAANRTAADTLEIYNVAFKRGQ